MEVELHALYSWLREAPVSVVSTYQSLRCLPHMDWPFLLVPFASDAAGDEFCLDFAADEHNPPVVYFAHDCPWEHCFYRLAESFDAFLEAYAEGKVTANFGLSALPSDQRERAERFL
jgi:cell wall assembly regulator SMI1